MATLEMAGIRPYPEPKPKKPSFETTKAFLQEAQADGAFERFLNIPQRSTELTRWGNLQDRNLKITQDYIESPNTRSQAEAGKKYGVRTKGRANQIIKETVEAIRILCSPNLQKQFPKESLILKKPKLATLGTSHKIAELTRQGKTQEDLRTAGFTAKQLRRVRHELKSVGINVPRGVNYERLAADLQDPNKTLQERQTSLDAIRSKESVDSLRKKRVVLSLYKFLLESGFRIFTYEVEAYAEFLRQDKENGIAIGKISYEIKSGGQAGLQKNYWYFAAADSQKALQILNALR